MDKIKVIVLFLVLIFVSGQAGCETLSKFRLPTGDKGQVISNVGLIVEFLPNQPPREYFATEEDSTFAVSLKLSNYGTEPVSGSISISDSLSDQYGGVYGEDSFYLDAAEEYEEGKIIPGEEIIRFEGFSYNYFKIKDEGDTTASIYVMLDTNYIFDVGKQTCINKPESVKDCNDEDSVIVTRDLGRSALTLPVTISRIEKQVINVGESTAQLKFDIFVKDTGKGFINNEDKAIDNFGLTFDRATSVKCTPSNHIVLKGKERRISCLVNLDVADFSQFADERFSIYFDYPYRFITTRDISIRLME